MTTRTRTSPLGGISRGARVRHPKFGVGTVVGVEPAAGDLKVSIRFTGIWREEASGALCEAGAGM